MTSGTRHGRECLLSIMTGAAASALVHVRHGHFRAAFLHGEELRMALVTCKRSMARVIEIHGPCVLDRICQRRGRGRGAPIFMASVTVIESVTILSGMTGETRLLCAVISEHNLCDTLLERKKGEMTTAAFKFSHMGLMVKRDRLLTVTEKNSLLGSRGFYVAAAAVIPGERLFAVMADEAIFLLSMISLGNFVGAFLDFE